MSGAPELVKITGLKHLFAAAGYSAGGAARAWKEAAFRQEILACAFLMAIYAGIGATLAILCAAIILFLLLFAVEALNTAIEEIVDCISPEISTSARHAKDLGSFAVFCLISANGLLLGYTLLMPILA